MKKKILCLVLALVLVGSAVGFFVYDKVGNTFDYAKKDLTKYITIAGIDSVNALYTSEKMTPDTVEEKDLQAAVASALASLQKDGTVGVVQMYDTLYVKYYAETEIDGETTVISKADTLDPSKTTSIQLGADSDLARLFVEHLLGKDVSGTSYRAYTTDAVMFGDKITYSYTKNGESRDEWKNLKAEVKGSDFLESIADGLTALYREKVTSGDAEIGEALELTLGEDTYIVTVHYALRNKVVGGAVVEGDHLRFTYYEITADGDTDVEGKGTTYTTALTPDKKETIDEKFGTGFYDKLLTLTIGEKSEKFTVTKTTAITSDEGESTTAETGEDESATTTTETKAYKVNIEYVEGREDISGLASDEVEIADTWYHEGENVFSFQTTYADDSEATADNDESIELKGKTVTYYVAVTGVKTLQYDYANIVSSSGLGYTVDADEDEKLSDLFTAYDAYKKAQDAYDDAKALTGDEAKTAEELAELEAAAAAALDTLYDKETAYIDSLEPEEGSKVKAYADAVKALVAAKKALSDAEALEGEAAKTEAELAELRDAVTAAEDALATALDAYAKEEGLYYEDVKYIDIAAKDAYEKQETKTLEDAEKDELAYAIAKEVWDKLLQEVAETVKYPSKAVRVAYRGLYDGYKTNYYSNRDETPYSNYKTFKSYLTQSAFAGKDYKTELTAEAQQIVLEKMVLYRLVEMYDIELTESQESIMTFYEYYMADSASEIRAAYLFDNLMQEITEQICPAVKKD